MARQTSDRTGKQLERLIAMLETVLAGSGATIEAPSRRLIDRDTGRPREHDVLITWDHGHHQIVTAIECRDRKRPVGVPDVGEFADKCSATGVNSGVIVSSTGFRNSARAKAAARAITCMELSEIEKFDWLGTDAIVEYQRRFGHFHFKVMFDDTAPESLEAIFDTNGTELTRRHLINTATRAVPLAETPEAQVGRVMRVHLRINTLGWTARDGRGDVWPISHLLVKTSYETSKAINKFRTHRYTGGGKDYAFASADLSLSDTHGKFIFLQNDDGSADLYLVPDKDQARTEDSVPKNA